MWEREQTGLAQGKFSEIKRDNWQVLTFESGVIVPFGQAGLLAGAVGLFSLAAAGMGGMFWDIPFKYPAAGAAVVASGMFAREVYRAVRWTRDNVMVSRERYSNRQEAQAAASNERITLEWIEHNADGSVKRAVYDELGISRERLALVARVDGLSKRTLMDVGIGDTEAMRLVSQLLALGYVMREADNQPAYWTKKGKALQRAFAGGGGGGGA
jgi:hypothetical protein